jgi:non-ribosomal peptide synthetase component E (peptide arylation enzyme)
VGGINWSLQALAQGAQVVSMQDFDPDAALAAIETFRVTHLAIIASGCWRSGNHLPTPSSRSSTS